MVERCDILLSGTGAFAARIAFDIAATTPKPVRVLVAGRNEERLAWIKLAGNSRAAMFHKPASFETVTVDFSSPDSIAGALQGASPKVVVQAASVQSPAAMHSTDTGWARFVHEGGPGLTGAFQALISSRVGRAMARFAPDALFINCCYPDVVNGILAAQGLPLACGVGNVAILAHMFEGDLGIREPGRVRVVAHYETLGPFREKAEDRAGKRAPRVWLDGKEIADVFGRFRHLKLTRQPVIDISGGTGVPIMYALAGFADYQGHAPGPLGLPGGYPITVRGRKPALDLPAGMTEHEAVTWNRSFEERRGLVVKDGRVQYQGPAKDVLARESKTLAEGFDVQSLEDVCREMSVLRDRLGQ
jgi:hypothetical protein